MSAAVADISGKPRIIDGDTVHIGDTKIRLHGIDAPEIKQTCKLNGGNWFPGRDAKNAIASLLADKTLVCRGTGQRSYNRAVARCYLDGKDLQDIIVSMGWAFDMPRYSHGMYAASELDAKMAGLGIWQGKCDKPWDWRRLNRR